MEAGLFTETHALVCRAAAALAASQQVGSVGLLVLTHTSIFRISDLKQLQAVLCAMAARGADESQLELIAPFLS